MQIVYQQEDLQALIAQELKYSYSQFTITVTVTDNGVVAQLNPKQEDANDNA